MGHIPKPIHLACTRVFDPFAAPIAEPLTSQQIFINVNEEITYQYRHFRLRSSKGTQHSLLWHLVVLPHIDTDMDFDLVIPKQSGQTHGNVMLRPVAEGLSRKQLSGVDETRKIRSGYWT